jgi:hypothetical protein
MDNTVNNQLNTPEPEPDTGEQIRYAYVVGVKNNGQFVFDVHGDEVGLIELMGLHQYADRRIKGVFDDNHGTGDAITMQLFKMLQELGAKLLGEQEQEEVVPVATTVDTTPEDAE